MGIDIRTGVDTQRGTKVRTIGENSKARERERDARDEYENNRKSRVRC